MSEPEKNACNVADHAELRAANRKLMAEAWMQKVKAAEASLTLPAGPYRLARITQSGAWRVEKWCVRTDPPPLDVAAYKAGDRYGHLSMVPQEFLRHQFPDYSGEPIVAVVWERFGPIEQFDTYEGAEAWLQGWLRPISDVVLFSPEGVAIKPAADGEATKRAAQTRPNTKPRAKTPNQGSER